LNYNRSLLFHGGDTGSTPVRDAKLHSIFAISTDIKQMKRFLMDLSVDDCGAQCESIRTLRIYSS